MHCTHALLRLRFLDLSGIFSQIAIKAGHEFIVSVDDKYSKACDDRVMYVDYVSLCTRLDLLVNCLHWDLVEKLAQGHCPWQAHLC